MALYGCFDGTTGTAREQRNPTANVTTLSGDFNGDDAGFTNNSENVYHVVTGATGATLDGFTITSGNANIGFNLLYGSYGGGMYNNSSSPTVTNVIFSGNMGGVGGGMSNVSSSPTLTNVTFSGNSAEGGGGMYNQDSNPTLTNVTFSGNWANSGGGMYNALGSPMLTNVTFSSNSAISGGGMYNYRSSLQIRNTILWGNTASSTGAQIYNNSSTSDVSYSVVQGGCPAGSTCTNIITSDPRLGALGNYGGFTQTIPLLPGSSAINTVNDATCAATDQRGVIRPQGAHCDIGAFEVLSDTKVFTIFLPLILH